MTKNLKFLLISSVLISDTALCGKCWTLHFIEENLIVPLLFQNNYTEFLIILYAVCIYTYSGHTTNKGRRSTSNLSLVNYRYELKLPYSQEDVHEIQSWSVKISSINILTCFYRCTVPFNCTVAAMQTNSMENNRISFEILVEVPDCTVVLDV